MPVYSYTAIDELGRKHRGSKDAVSESVLESLLKEDGKWLADAKPLKSSSLLNSRKKNPSIPRRALIEFFLQLSIQLKAGIPIFTALSFGATECTHKAFREVQQDLLDKVESGELVSDSMERYPRTFPSLVINLMRAGETSGRLSETCHELHCYYEWLERLVADIRQALVYPAFVLVSTLGFMFLLFTFLIPKFATLLTELKVPLPALTRIVMGISDFAVAHWLWLILLPVATIIGIKMGNRHSPRVANFLDQVKLHLPIFGNLNRLICLSRFAHNLAVLYRSGVPLLESLKLSRGLVGNRVVANAIGEIESGVNEGVSMHEVMSRQTVFSRLILQMVKVGESTGNLGESLQNVAEYYNEIIPRQIKKMFTILEPAMILFLIGLVATVAMAIFLPIANLLGAG